MKRTIIGAAQQLLKTTCVASTTLDKWLPTQRRTVVAEDLGARKLLGCRLPVAMDASAEMPKVGDWRLAAAFDSGTKFRRLLWTLAERYAADTWFTRTTAKIHPRPECIRQRVQKIMNTMCGRRNIDQIVCAG